jgi:hypothetical protein
VAAGCPYKEEYDWERDLEVRLCDSGDVGRGVRTSSIVSLWRLEVIEAVSLP